MLQKYEQDLYKDALVLLRVEKTVRKDMLQHANSFNVDFDNEFSINLFRDPCWIS